MDNFTFLESGLVNVFLPAAIVAVFAVILNVIDKFTTASHLRIPDKQHSWRANNENGVIVFIRIRQSVVIIFVGYGLINVLPFILLSSVMILKTLYIPFFLIVNCYVGVGFITNTLRFMLDANNLYVELNRIMFSVFSV